MQKPRKILVTKSSKQVGSLTSAERGICVTLCVAASAARNLLSFIFSQNKCRDYLDHDEPADFIGGDNSSGGMTGTEYRIFIKHFIDSVKPSIFNPVLLVLDNHSSH